MSTDRLQSHATGAAKPARRLAFSTPVGVSAVAVVAVAIIAGLLLFGPRGLFGLGPGPAASPTTPSAESASAGPSPTSPEAATAGPSADPAPTPVPTPEPTPEIDSWVGLEWSEPIEPNLNVSDAIWWHDRYVGVGSVTMQDHPSDGETTHVPLFLSSPDGVAWDVVQELEPILDPHADTFTLTKAPEAVVPAGDGLLAMGFYGWGGGPRTLWHSSDGLTWSEVESPTWNDAWQGATVRGIAGGPAGVVAIGFEGSGCCMNPMGAPIVLHSSDGSMWEPVTPEAPPPALLSDVASFAGGFVLGGRVGERDGTDEDPIYIGTGVAAVWSSPDGRTWTAATVEGVEPVRGGGLWDFAVGANGLFATGHASAVDDTHPGFYGHGDAVLSGWASTDGSRWRYLGEAGDELPAIRLPTWDLHSSDLESDGVRMLALVREGPGSIALAGWTSLDGVTWTRLAFTGSQPPTRDPPITEEEVAQWGATGGVESARLTRDGVVVRGSMAWVAHAIVGD
jgi:hypothetical protein